MIQIDTRAGSEQFIPLVRNLGLEVEPCRLDFGDACFMGWGPNQALCSVGLEIKSVSDCIACVISGRFAGHQLPGLIRSYDHIWLLVYGICRTRADGILEEARYPQRGGMYFAPIGGGKRLWFARDLESWFLSMQIMGGLRVHRVGTVAEAAQWLKTLYAWHQREEHKSHLAMYSSKEIYSDAALLAKPSLARRIAAQLPGVGYVKSSAVAAQFKSVEEMVAAAPGDWAQIDGIGKQLSQRIWMAIHQRNS